MSKSKLTAKQKREVALFEKLQAEHGYAMLELRRKADRHVVTYSRSTGKMEMARAIQLVVPPSSALALALDGTRTGKETIAKRAPGKVSVRK